MKNSIAIILGRKGSKSVKDKNVMLLNHKPLYKYSFTAAKKSKYISDIFVATDHDEIRNAAKKNKFHYIYRPKKLNTDNALFDDALIYAYNKTKTILDYRPKYIVILMCNVATIDEHLIDQAIDKLEKNKDADSAVTVSMFNMYSPLRARKINKKGFLEPFVPLETFGNPKTLNCDRGSQGDSYFADMSHSVVRSECLEKINDGLLPQKWMGKKILPIINNWGCDIDDPWQIDMSRRWLKSRDK